MKYRIFFSLLVVAVIAALFVLTDSQHAGSRSYQSSSPSPVNDNELKSLKID